MEISRQLNDPRGTVWALYSQFPVDLLVQHAKLTGCLFPKRLKAVKQWMKQGRRIRAVLVDSTESEPWIEGFHRTMAAKELGIETIPVWLRIK